MTDQGLTKNTHTTLKGYYAF